MGAAKDIEGVPLHLRHVRDHREALLAERQPTLIAQEQLATDPFLQSVHPAHQRRARQAEYVSGIAETLVSCTDEKRFQIVPGSIDDFVRAALRHRSTPVQ